ncbi:MAG: hypothetical protein GX195_11230 [Firmicutes bacterium]|jgi:spore maturation protein A|nr:hypothetical protein [Bacillota bacterium]
MINYIWFFMIASGILVAALDGRIEVVTEAIVRGAEQGITIALGLAGLIAFWSGMMQIAQESGLMAQLARTMRPIGRKLFPDVPPDHPAMGAVLLAMAANVLGLGNACTPLGIKAMEELQKLNPSKDTASNSMCTFVVLTASSLTILPGTIIALRAAQGSSAPAEVVGTIVFATSCSSLAAFLIDRVLRRFW